MIVYIIKHGDAPRMREMHTADIVLHEVKIAGDDVITRNYYFMSKNRWGEGNKLVARSEVITLLEQ
jgi:hypothetical protein